MSYIIYTKKARMSDQEKIVKEILVERDRQDRLWGVQDHEPFKWVTILLEEVGEYAQDVLEGRMTHAREEVVQIAAVAMAIVESMDRVSNEADDE